MAVGHLAGAMQNNVVSPLWWFIQLIHVDSVFVVCLGIQNSFRVSDLTFHEQIHSSIIADLQSWGCFRVLGDHLVQMFLVQLKFRNCFKCLKALHGIHSILSVFFLFFSPPYEKLPGFFEAKTVGHAVWSAVVIGGPGCRRPRAKQGKRRGSEHTDMQLYFWERELPLTDFSRLTSYSNIYIYIYL